ncbi:MAG: hypothetical protein NZ108_05410, partial [Bacteroidia bacterium]|nr:hypothetical protein [Bacteroidia bacterium]
VLTVTPDTICRGETATISASGASTYVWNPGNLSGSSVNVSPLTNTTYTVTGTSAAGCVSSPTNVPVTVIQPVTPTISGTNIICPGGSTTLTASGAQSYTWLPGGLTGSSVTVSPTNTTTYTINSVNNGCPGNQVTYVVTVSPNPSVNAGNDVSICPNGTANLGTAAVPGLTYAWSPTTGLASPNAAQTTVSLPNAGSTPVIQTYILSATSSIGCVGRDTVIVTVNPNPTVSVSGNNTICINTSTTLTASGAASYSWNPGNLSGTSITVSPTTNTTYTVVGTSVAGCVSAPTTYAVSVVNQVQATISGNLTICQGQSTTLTANVATSYSWSPGGQTTQSITVSPTTTTTYTVNIVAAGCPGLPATAVVTVNPLPVANAGADVAYCTGSSAQIGTPALAGHTYSWSPATGLSSTSVAQPIVNFTNTGTTPIQRVYTVTVTGPNGCTNTDSVVVTINPLPVPTINGNTTICRGNSTTLTASSGVSWLWTGGSTNQSITINPLINTTINLQVTDANGCVKDSTFAITVIQPDTANITGNLVICSGQSTTLTETTIGATHSWNPGGSTSASITVSPTSTTTYTVNITKNGCPGIPDSVVVTVNPLPVADAGPDVAFCTGNTVTIGSSPIAGNSYSWTPTTGLSNATIANPTLTLTNNTSSPVVSTYILTVTSPDGCIRQDSVRVTVNPLPVASISGNITICRGASTVLTGNGGISYQWSTNEITSQITVSPLSNTSYSVIATDANGCVSLPVSVLINVTQPTQAIISGDTNICLGESTTLTATNGTSWIWSPGGQATQTITVSPTITTDYILNIVDNGCPGLPDTVRVIVNPLPTVNAGPDVATCTGLGTIIG